MRKSTISQGPYAHEQQEEEDGVDQDESENEETDIGRRKKVIIPRFVKNELDQIDTNVIILNISKTQYEVVEEVGKQLGWQIQKSKKSQKWDIMWIDSHIEAHDLFKLNQHQKISHYPSIYVLTRKNFLGRSLMKMRNYFPDEYSFFPSTWSIPADFTELLRFDEKLHKSEEISQFYIYKPEALAQGKGIKLCENVTSLEGKIGIVQQYINNPYLIENLKFDLRIYVLILGYEPLRIFIYDEGLGRFATEKYQRVKKKNMKDVHMHLTNYAINKNNKNFVFNSSEKDMNKGHKRSLSAIYAYLSTRGVDINKLKKTIDQMIIKTLIVGQPMIAHTYGLAQADTNSNDLCFQILGFDVLINENLDPILLEVNHTPSFKTDTPLDNFIKRNLIKDTLNLLNVNTENKKQKIQLKKQFIEMRSQRKLTKLTSEEREEIKKKKWKERDQYELAHLGNFRKIFPVEQSYKYKEMIEVSNKIFNEANGIKNKNVSSKLSYTTRPQSFQKSNTVSGTCPILGNIKEKTIAQPSSHKSKTNGYELEGQGIHEKLLKSSKQKFPEIGSTYKRQEKNRNFSGYMASSLKQEAVKQAIHKLQRTASYSKKSNLQPIQSQLCSKGSYVLPKVLEMAEIGGSQKYIEVGHSPEIGGNKMMYLNKGRNFEEVANEACLQIQSLSPAKATYENLLMSLSMSNACNYSKEEFIKLKPVKKT